MRNFAFSLLSFSAVLASASVDTTGLLGGWEFTTYLVDINECPNSVSTWDPADFQSPASGTTATVNVADANSWPAPYSVGSADCFVTIHEGVLVINTAGRYDFRLGSNDGSVLTINGIVVSFLRKAVV